MNPTMSGDGFTPEIDDVRLLSCAARAAMKARLVARGREARNRLLRQCIAGAARIILTAGRSVRDPAGAIRTIARLYRARRRRMTGLQQLTAMSDLELGDIGISRTEIRAAARSDAPWPRHGLRDARTTAPARGDSAD